VGGAGVGPAADGDGPAALARPGQGGDDGGECCELLGARLAADDAQERLIGGHSGMFPCFFGGSVSRLFASTRSALVTCTRVWDGGMTMSTKPRSAAM
jgi:hypothetical protein